MADFRSDDAGQIVKYIGEHKILVVDRSATGRASIAKMLVEMGSKTYNILLASSYLAAESEIKNHSPTVIISDYRINDMSMLSLVSSYRLDPKINRECIFILVTNNASESSIAEAAEEDVDSYILRPVSAVVLKKYLVTAILRKLHPTPFIEAVFNGKEALLAKDYDAAVNIFLQASKMPDNPGLAFSLLGQTEYARRKFDQAENYYLQGLEGEKKHYRCLVGAFDMLFSQKKMIDAYEMGCRLAEEFPLSAQRLENMLHLIVHNKKFDSVFDFYDRYMALDEKSLSVTKCMAAVLVLTGKFMCSQGKMTDAKLAFKNALEVSDKNVAIFREIMVSLVEYKLLDVATFFLNEFQPHSGTPGSKEEVLYRTLRFLLANQTDTLSQIIEYGRKLLAEDIYDPLIYEVMIQRAREAKLDAYVETLCFDAVKRWPELKSKFQV